MPNPSTVTSHLDDLRQRCVRELGLSKTTANALTDEELSNLSVHLSPAKCGNREGRVQFESGAVRSNDGDLDRYDLISPQALRRVARRYGIGGVTYGDGNYLKGIPVPNVLRHAEQHLQRYKFEGNVKDDNLAAVVWNCLTIMHYEETGRSELFKGLIYQEEGVDVSEEKINTPSGHVTCKIITRNTGSKTKAGQFIDTLKTAFKVVDAMPKCSGEGSLPPGEYKVKAESVEVTETPVKWGEATFFDTNGLRMIVEDIESPKNVSLTTTAMTLAKQKGYRLVKVTMGRDQTVVWADTDFWPSKKKGSPELDRP
jgi:hypothetical protein